ncbi:MAG: hypothetical protein ACM3NG_00195 [Candidatus Doudnabacteria bacterium]
MACLPNDALLKTAVTRQEDVKKEPGIQGRWAMRPAALALALLGLAILAFWYLTNDGSTTAMVAMLAGLGVLTIAVLLYFISPSRYLSDEVADAIALSSVRNVRRILSAMLIEAPGIYVPASKTGTTRIFIPVSGSSSRAPEAGGVFVAGPESKGIFLEPPGYALLSYAHKIGSSFTDKQLENELADVLENVLELGRKVTVRRKGNRTIEVSISDPANAGMCRRLRKEGTLLCTQMGCPICSFTACAIVEATGRPVRIADVSVQKKKINTTFELI